MNTLNLYDVLSNDDKEVLLFVNEIAEFCSSKVYYLKYFNFGIQDWESTRMIVDNNVKDIAAVLNNIHYSIVSQNNTEDKAIKQCCTANNANTYFDMC